MAYNGKFKPKNPKKYIGKVDNIIYRSFWEFKFMNYLDSHPEVISWASEEFFIPYLSPKTGKIQRYFPDFLIKKKDPIKGHKIVVVEIKPFSQTMPPKKPKTVKAKKRFMTETVTYAVNSAKWKAAMEYCKDRNWQFVIMTEHELGIKNGK